MNADELDAAREAVSATRTWRDQMRADWGTNFREPEEVLDEAVGELLAERERLRAVVDVADDFWPLIESIYDAALAAWEYGDERMKYVTVQISKVDLPTLRAAYAGPTGEDT